jgi:hypothetical protein
MKNLIKTASLLVFAACFACSNNTTSPAASSPAASDTTTSSIGLAFNGNSDSGQVVISLADDYLEKVVNGDPYSVTPGVLGFSAKSIKTQVALTGFSYLGQSVDVTCDKDNAANTLFVALTGSNPTGQSIQFLFNPNDGLYYTFKIPSFTLIGAQGTQDEIETIYVSDIASDFILPYADTPQTFSCSGSDSNAYNVIFHTKYDNSMQIQSIFDVKDKIFTGVIEVVKNNSSDSPVQLFFDK